VSISLQSVTSSPVTVSVSADGQAASTLVQSFVTAANTVLQSISTDTAYNETTNTAGTLNGDFQLQGLAQQILAVVGQAIGTSTAADAGTAGSAAGLSVDAKTGQIDFDTTTFATDFENSPSAVTQRSPSRAASRPHLARRPVTVMSASSTPATTPPQAATASS